MWLWEDLETGEEKRYTLANFAGLEFKGTTVNIRVWSKRQNIISRSKRVNYHIC